MQLIETSTWELPRWRRPWRRKAAMATSSVDDNGRPSTQHADGDHYSRVATTSGASADLPDVFKTAASTLAQGTKLVQLP